MRHLIAAVVLAGSVAPAWSDGYVMGSGRWTCAQAIQAWEGKPIDKGQLAGWIMGYWSAATFERETKFVDTVEKVGGLKIVEATLSECRKAPGETLLYKVTRSMIVNTK